MMKILFDITHPAHAHFFRNPINMLLRDGHSVVITSRVKDCTIELLDEMGFEHTPISRQQGGSVVSMASELVQRNWRLLRIVRKEQPDKLAALGGTSAAQVGFLTRTPSLVFYDTEDARLQNMMTYPFANRVVVPDCYKGWVPQRREYRYPGYHELSYLAPDYFSPDRDIALQNGLAEQGNTYLVRLVSWKASHDVGLAGWSRKTLASIVSFLQKTGKVIISSESSLPEEFAALSYSGSLNQIHHLMAFCKMYVGESATMASEAAVLGVPAVYAAPAFRGYVSEQEERFGMARFVPRVDSETVLSACRGMLDVGTETIKKRHQTMLSECMDVATMVRDLLIDR
jgi:predicted glycosyltransferase